MIIAKLRTLVAIMLVGSVISACTPAKLADRHRRGTNAGAIVIGVSWPFTTRPTLFWEGVEMATAELNASGGVINRQLNVLRADDHAEVTRGMAVAHQFAENPDMVAVIGPMDSPVAIPTAAIYADSGVLMLTPGATIPELTERGHELVFRSIPSDAKIGREMARYAAARGLKNVVIFYQDNGYGRGLAASFEDQGLGLGINVVDRTVWFGSPPEMRRQVRKWEALGYDAVFVADVMPAAAAFIASLRQAGSDVPVLGGDALDSSALWTLAGVAAEGTVVGSIFNPEDQRPEVQQFRKAFQDRYGSEPDAWAAQGYDAVRLLAAAMESAGSAEPVLVAARLRGQAAWSGVTGSRSFNANGEVAGIPVVLKVVRQARFEYLSGTGNFQQGSVRP